MLAGWYVFSLLVLPFLSSLHIMAMNTSFRHEDEPLLPKILVQNVSVASNSKSTSTSKSTPTPTLSPPTGGFHAAPLVSSSASTPHSPFPSSPTRPAPLGHLPASSSTHTPVTQPPSSPDDPIPNLPHHSVPSHAPSHHPNSSDIDIRTHPPFHPHPPPPTPSTHARPSGPSVTQIFFAAFGGVVVLIILLAIARCIYVYRKTPGSRRPPTPEIGEVERTLALLRPSRTLNLGNRIIPPPPYQPAPDYDDIIASDSDGNDATSTSTHPSSSGSATTGTLRLPNANGTNGNTNNDLYIPTPTPHPELASDSNATVAPLPSQSIPNTPADRPPDAHIVV